MSDAKDFKAAVKSATADALASRYTLGNAYAAEFLRDPEHFDPQKLSKLGRPGLSSFVTAVGVAATNIDWHAAERTKDTAGLHSESSHWENQRVVPIPFELVGLLLGCFAGFVIIFGCALLLNY